SDISLQFVFFDGEEAYVQWTSTDSLYGARHLAEFWERNPDPATAAAFSSLAKQEPELERIDVMVLLDLIGAPDNAFVALQEPTANLFMELSKLEHRLHDAGYINRTYMNTDHPVAAEYIEDDHIPFIRRFDTEDKADTSEADPLDVSHTVGASVATKVALSALSGVFLLLKLVLAILAVTFVYILVIAYYVR
ncbi:hypothetical protein H4S06_001027, partial [Coemansia sp. BCRC 34490]